VPFEITYQTAFAAAHAILLPDGSLEPVHGHNWSVAVTVAAPELDAIETVMDFHDLERIVQGITASWHNRDLNGCPPFADAGRTDRHGLAISPTAERVAEHLGTAVAAQLPAHTRLVGVTVGEAPGCTATYRPER
jgi:6-pyruvoyltetrahydropterin/6-carboxytetrahydropterin synthase